MEITLLQERDLFWWVDGAYVVTFVGREVVSRHLDVHRRGSRRRTGTEHFGNGKILRFKQTKCRIDLHPEIMLFGQMKWSAWNEIMDKDDEEPP